MGRRPITWAGQGGCYLGYEASLGLWSQEVIWVVCCCLWSLGFWGQSHLDKGKSALKQLMVSMWNYR